MVCTSVQGASFCSSKEEEVSHLEEQEAWTGRNCVGLEKEIWSRVGFVKFDMSLYIKSRCSEFHSH